MALFRICCFIAPTIGAKPFDNTALALEYSDQDQNPPAGQGKEVNIKGVKVVIPDVVLRDQQGRRVRFYSDLIKGKVIVLNFFYTNCSYVCPMQGTVFSQLQSLLGERLGKSVFMISVTTDPLRDSPEQLKAWATRYDAKPGWTFVTGEEAEINKLLLPFTGNRAGGGMHLPATFIGNDRSGFWTSGAGMFAPEDIAKTVDYITQ